MIKTLLQKSSSLVIVLLFGFFVYGEFLAFPEVAKGDSGIIPIERSRTINKALGGTNDTMPITVFVTSWCPLCKALESDLKKKGVDYVVVDIEKNKEGLNYYAQVTQGSTRGVPVAVVGEDVFVGYQEAAINASISKLQKSGVKAPSLPKAVNAL